MKFAVVQSGGKQYLAQEGQAIEVDQLPLEVGASIALREILLAADDGQVLVGAPFVEGVSIRATVAAQVKGPKVRVFKYIPKERYRRRAGHRQRYTRLLVESIILPGGGAAAKDEKAATAEGEGRSKAAAREAEGKSKPAKKPAAKAIGQAAGAKKPPARKSK